MLLCLCNSMFRSPYLVLRVQQRQAWVQPDMAAQLDQTGPEKPGAVQAPTIADIVTTERNTMNLTPLYPEVSENSHASPRLVSFLHTFFTAKSQHNPSMLMNHFSEGSTAYIDATLGWASGDYKAVGDMFGQYMPTWPKTALSYPTRIHGDEHSALVEFVDTPELFGGEIRALGVVDFKNGKVVRWVDYWESRTFGAAAAATLRAPADKFPDMRYNIPGDGASGKITSVSTQLSDALHAEDSAAASALFSNDAVYEDMALHTMIRGKIAIGSYLRRVVGKAPFGKGARLVHVVGSDQGGGYEWVNEQGAVHRGVTAIDLDRDGKIVRLVTTWDNGVMSDGDYQALLLAAQP